MKGKRHTTEERVRILREADGGKGIQGSARSTTPPGVPSARSAGPSSNSGT